MERVLVAGVKRYTQRTSECALAACASLANYYDSEVNYSYLRGLVPPSKRVGGMYTPQQGLLLNRLGYTHITIVSADYSLFDWTWAKLSKKSLVSKLKRKKIYLDQSSVDEAEAMKHYIKWLQMDGCNNNLIIDYNFPKYIKRHLNAGRPVGASFNWTAMFKLSKYDKNGKNDSKGDAVEHAVVLRGYDNEGVFVVDSHTRFYRGRLKKYKSGRYKVPWSKFLVNAPYGDLLLIH